MIQYTLNGYDTNNTKTGKQQMTEFQYDSYRTHGLLITLEGNGPHQGYPLNSRGTSFPKAWVSYSAPDEEMAKKEDNITISKTSDNGTIIEIEWNLWDEIPSEYDNPLIRELVEEAIHKSLQRAF